MALGNRPSSLDIASYCPASPRLSTGGYGRASLMSSYFHALCAFGLPKGEVATEEQEATAHLRAMLTADELADVETWQQPEPIVVDGFALTYADALKEVQLALASDLHTPVPFDDSRAICQGTADMLWVFPKAGIVFVGDIKKSKWTCPEGPMSLQLAFYGRAACAKFNCSRYVPGFWFPEDNEWAWGRSVAPFGFEEWELMERLQFAINNTEGPAVTGSHCSACYNRMRCSEYLLPAALNQTRLAPISEGGPEFTPESASEMLLSAQRAIKVAEAEIDAVKEWSRRGGIVSDGKLRYKPSMCKGRMTFDAKAACEENPELAARYQKQGKGYSMFRWTKEGK